MTDQTPITALFLAGAALLAAPAHAEDEALILKPITVETAPERGDGPVDGYVTRRTLAGAKTDTPLEKIPQSISVVPARQIADQGATSVAEALRYAPGVFTEYRGASNFHDEMFVRGFSYAPRFLDGLKYGTGSLGQIDPHLLERVELVKGPSSILYGQVSPGGLVNLVTKTPTGETGGEVQATVGTANRIGVAGDVQGTFDKAGELAWRVVATAELVDTQEDKLEERGFSVAPSLTWRPDAGRSLTVSAIASHDPEAGFRNFREAAGSITPTGHGYIPREFLVSDPDIHESERTQLSAGWRYEQALGDGLTLRSNARVANISSAYTTLTWGSLQADEVTISRTGSGGEESLLQLAADTQLEARVATGAASHTLLAGVDMLYSRRDYKWAFDFDAPSINWTDPVYGIGGLDLSDRPTDTETKAGQIGFYLQDQVDIGAVSITAGARYDFAETTVDNNLTGARSTISDQALTGRLGALYAFGNGISPYASVSTSFEPVTTSPASGAPNFDPSEGLQFEAGVKWADPEGRFMLTASLFQIVQTNVITYDETRTPVQTGEIETRGLELEARAQVSDALTLIGSYSFIDQDVTATDTASALGKMPSRVPSHQAAVWAKYAFAAGVDAGGGLRYVGQSWGDAANTFKVDEVVLVDAAISYDLGRLSPDLRGARVQVNATNLFDQDYTASCASAYACFAGSGRAVTAKLSYAW